jgi:putative transposase
MPRRKAPHIPDELLDQLLAGADAKTAFDANGLLDALKKALAERALNAEMTIISRPTKAATAGTAMAARR